MGCHLIVNCLSGDCRKALAGTSLGAWSGEENCGTQAGDHCDSNVGEETINIVDSCRTSRRMHLGLGNIDRVRSTHRVAQALGKKAKNPTCLSAGRE